MCLRLAFALTVLALAGSSGYLCAQEDAPQVDHSNDGWQRTDWLKSAEEKERAAASGDTVTEKTTQNINDPFAVTSSTALWQENYNAIYTRRVADSLTLSYETSSTLLDESSTQMNGTPDDLSRGEKVGLQFTPGDPLTLSANLHASSADGSLPGDTSVTSGASVGVEGHLPYDSTLTLGANTDRSGSDASLNSFSTDNSFDAQFQKPLGKLPLTAVVKSHYEQITSPGVPAGRLPSFEQSLVWKPVPVSTIQMGLRQQQYQEYPGINNQTNEALFADWSQNVVGSVTWHSYAEVLNSRGLIDQAPASPLANGANGTPQATAPGSNNSLSSSVPLSLQDQTLTFSTGPSFRLQKDISASVEYSNRWDKTPAAGNVGQEQRVSVSVKGTF